jgi:hypothetical protein
MHGQTFIKIFPVNSPVRKTEWSYIWGRSYCKLNHNQFWKILLGLFTVELSQYDVLTWHVSKCKLFKTILFPNKGNVYKFGIASVTRQKHKNVLNPSVEDLLIRSGTLFPCLSGSSWGPIRVKSKKILHFNTLTTESFKLFKRTFLGF